MTWIMPHMWRVALPCHKQLNNTTLLLITCYLTSQCTLTPSLIIGLLFYTEPTVDFYPWGYLKTLVYQEKIVNISRGSQMLSRTLCGARPARTSSECNPGRAHGGAFNVRSWRYISSSLTATIISKWGWLEEVWPRSFTNRLAHPIVWVCSLGRNLSFVHGLHEEHRTPCDL